MRSLTFLFLLLMPLTAGAAVEAGFGKVREHLLDVAVAIDRSAVTGTVRFAVAAGATEQFRADGLSISAVTVNGIEQPYTLRDGELSFVTSANGTAEIRFAGIFATSESVGDRNYGVVTSVIDRRGVSLTGSWYPRPAILGRWKLTASLPAGYEAVSEAETVVRTEEGDRRVFAFDFPYPLDSLSLVASDRFEVVREKAGSVEVFGYFFKEDRQLARTYLDHARKYLALYEKMLAPYPFKRFSVVENFLSTGYSLPTFTLLGQDVVRLPFIVETSLGHEILHQWFGNSVYVDEREGNWCEGLTSYLADHWYDELKGKGGEHRKQLLVNFGAYVNEKNDFPLREFRGRTDLASRAIGYGKSAMVFHMLRRRAGDERFFGALRAFLAEQRFREASWSDLRRHFEKATGSDLRAFFEALLTGKGLPDIQVERAAARRKGDGFEISFEVTRKNIPVPLELPVEITFLRGGSRQEQVTLDQDRKSFRIDLDQEPARVVVDGDYDLLRRLSDEEMPPVIAAVTGDARPLVVTTASEAGTYDRVVNGLTSRGGEVKDAGSVKDSDLRSRAVVLLGRDNPVALRLYGSPEPLTGGFSITVRKNPWDPEHVVAMVHATSAAEAEAAFEKIYHYGKYSALSFENGRNRAKDIALSERGIAFELREPPLVLDVRSLKPFASVVEGVAEKQIVYVGEFHDRFSHHNVQTDLIRALFERDRTIAVGMEMFQRPFQGTLDEYISGAIGEREFLDRSEYFKRWGFDYNLYKPILDFCRRNRIPVVALNLRREITEKVSRSGMDSLTEDERKELPRETDFSNEEYRDRLQEVFAQHRAQGSPEKNFDHFLQAQVLWDETMAESVDAYLRKNPGRRMVVLAGSGHIANGSGIPKRAHRRNGASYSIVLNDGELSAGAADYIIFPQPLDGLTAPRLLASFREDKKRLVFADLAKDSPALRAGLRSGDALIALDGVPASDLQEVKRALFYKKKGDVILVTVERKGFLFGATVRTVEVKF